MMVMYKNMSFKAWLKFFSTYSFLYIFIVENRERRKIEVELGLDRMSGDEEYIQNDDDHWEYQTEEDLPATSEEDGENNEDNLEDKLS